jgi:hypothetical protein
MNTDKKNLGLLGMQTDGITRIASKVMAFGLTKVVHLFFKNFTSYFQACEPHQPPL